MVKGLKFRLRNSFNFRVLMCFLFVIILFLLCFSGYIFNLQRKQSVRIMENYNKSIVSSISQNFSVINDTALKAIMRALKLQSVTRLIYQENDDSDQHYMDIQELNHEFLSIPNLDSAVTYNKKTQIFETYRCNSANAGNIFTNIKENGRQFFSYTPYITMITSASGQPKPVFTYYGYDYLDGDTMDGAVAVNLNIDWLEEDVRHLGLEGMNVLLCESTGEIVYDYSKSGRTEQQADESYINKILANVGMGGFSAVINGRKNYVSVEELPSTNYLIVCEQPYSAMRTDYMRQIWLNMIVLVIVILIIGFIIARILSGYISAPVNKLTRYIPSEAESNDDMFKALYKILDNNAYNTFQMNEMKKTIEDYCEQNNLIMLMNGNRDRLEISDYNALEDFFGGGEIVGAELLFDETVIDVGRVRKICQMFLEDFAEYKFVTVEHNDFILLLKGQEDTQSFGILLESLKKRLETETDQLVSVFVSSGYHFDELKELYGELQFIRGYELIYGRSCLLDKKIIQENHGSGKYSYPKKEENNLLKAIINKNLEEVEMVFGSFLSKIMDADVHDFKTSILRLAINIQGLFEVDSKKLSDCYNDIVAQVNNITKLKTMNDVCDSFSALFDVCCNAPEENAAEKFTPTVCRMIDFIGEHYADSSLNLDMVADELKLSADYIGKKFKAETGVSLNRYLTEYRLKKSIFYLNETDGNISSIVEKVGFANESNFYRQFKKYYGITPGEYKTIQ